MRQGSFRTKRALWASAFSLVICFAMLLGTTFAWFTDVVSSKENLIQAGTLKLTATGLDANGSFVCNFTRDSNSSSSNRLIDENNWEPGRSNTRYIMVTNSGSLDLKFDLVVDVVFKGLEEVVLYDLTQVDLSPSEGGKLGRADSIPPDTFFPREIDWSLAKPVKDFPEDGVLIPEMVLPCNENHNTALFRLDYKMCEGAGNTYQNKSFSADITVAGIQNIAWNDRGLYYIRTSEDLVNGSYEQGQTLVFLNDIDLTAANSPVPGGNLTMNKLVNIDLNGFMLKANNITFASEGRCSMDLFNGVVWVQQSLNFNTPNAYVNVYGRYVKTAHTPPDERFKFIRVAGYRLDIEDVEISRNPDLDIIQVGAFSMTGAGIPGSTITILWPNGTTSEVVVDQSGFFEYEFDANSPYKPTEENDSAGKYVYIYQTESGKLPSETISSRIYPQLRLSESDS